MKKKINTNNSFLILITALLLGLLGGVFSFFYLWQNFPNNYWGMGGDVDLGSPEYSSANLVIQDPRRVYISQDLKIDETVSYLSGAVVGFFPKEELPLGADEDNYLINEKIISGLIISNDGWVLINSLSLDNFSQNIFSDKESLVAILKKDKKTYAVEDFFHDNESGLSFVKIKTSSSFSVRELVSSSDLIPGKTVLSYNFFGDTSVNSIKSVRSDDLINFFDNHKSSLLLNKELGSEFAGEFVFDLNGSLLALVDSKKNIVPVHNFRGLIYEFLDKREINHFKLGVYYMDLSHITGDKTPLNGAWIYNNNLSPVVKGSLADLSGIEKGDIILRVNNYDINSGRNLNDALNYFSYGDEVSFFILRNGELFDLKIKLK
jgi:S1-C subfamily serine protease